MENVWRIAKNFNIAKPINGEIIKSLKRPIVTKKNAWSKFAGNKEERYETFKQDGMKGET